MNKFLEVLRFLMVGLVLTGATLRAQTALPPISGVFGISGNIYMDAPSIADVTVATRYSSLAKGASNGTFTNVPNTQTIVCAPFTFIPATQSVTKFFIFTNNNVVYSFDTTSLVVAFHNSTSLVISGTGIAHITSYRDTPGTWSLATQNPSFGGNPTTGYSYLMSVSFSVLPTYIPNLSISARTNGQAIYSWNALAGQPYQLQSVTDLIQSNWSNFGSAVVASNTTVVITNLVGTEQNRFFRVRLLP